MTEDLNPTIVTTVTLPDGDILLPVPEVTAALGITRQAFFLWRRRPGRFPPPVHVHGRMFWRRSVLDRFLTTYQPHPLAGPRARRQQTA